jgi:hypothetical protein
MTVRRTPVLDLGIQLFFQFDTQLRRFAVVQRKFHLAKAAPLLHAPPDAIVHELLSVGGFEVETSHRSIAQDFAPESLAKLFVEVQDEHDANVHHNIFRKRLYGMLCSTPNAYAASSSEQPSRGLVKISLLSRERIGSGFEALLPPLGIEEIWKIR